MEFPELDTLVMLSRLCVAFLVGAVIGLERERHQRPAGLRTHMLVSLASALFAMVSILAAGESHDPGRIAAQVVTGIGFLGAGTIMRHGSTIKGLTTAASLWTAAALGLAAGFGWYMAATAGAVLVFLALSVLKYLEDQLAGCPVVPVDIMATPGQDPLPQVLGAVRSLGGTVERVKMEHQSLQEGLAFTVRVALPPECDRGTLLRTLANIEGVRDVEPDK